MSHFGFVPLPVFILFLCPFPYVHLFCLLKDSYELMDEWIKNMEYYSAIKKNEILPFATMWTELEGIMLREISQSEKGKYHMTSLI